jgi:hypothetical protein
VAEGGGEKIDRAQRFKGLVAHFRRSAR